MRNINSKNSDRRAFASDVSVKKKTHTTTNYGIVAGKQLPQKHLNAISKP